MGKDRQEKKLRKSGQVEADRDQSLKYAGSAKMQSPEQAREAQRP
ncbi:YpzI family protein [Alkalihalobacillus sp. MEB130]|nr:YpzI family protein [Alkalihalobacillus sp. MEB130]MDT8860029.1 YpzI family protein [Alkalihalobacillus sp. MEB130]